MLGIVSLWYFVALLFLPAQGQFNIFEQMFGGHPGHGQQQQRPSGASQWNVQAEMVPCSQYLCPETFVCVSNPADCPCPDVQDIKCLIPDSEEKAAATVVCVRGEDGCDALGRFTRKH